MGGINKELTVKFIQSLIAVFALALVSFSSVAQIVAASACTLDLPEAQVVTPGTHSGATCKINGVRVDNRGYVTADLLK